MASYFYPEVAGSFAIGGRDVAEDLAECVSATGSGCRRCGDLVVVFGHRPDHCLGSVFHHHYLN
jgi:hypothetical protein